MDPAESAVAIKRVSRWSHGDKQFVVELTRSERELVMTLVALLDARPTDVVAADR